MTLSNHSDTPRKWSDDELEAGAARAVQEFVDRRLAEPGGRYLVHVEARRGALLDLFRLLRHIDPTRPDPAIIREILQDRELFDALRYVGGPPVSEDDLGVLVTRSVQGLNKTDIRTQDRLPIEILQLICRIADPTRFPWITERRDPTARELRLALAATASMHAAQSLQTERRGHGKIIEQRFEQRLIDLGFRKISGETARLARHRARASAAPENVVLEPPRFPARGRVTQPTHHPVYPQFYGECTVYGRKVDLFVALRTGRMIALEAKDSSSALNSTKRLLNDTAAKARHYTAEAGRNIISVALLSGVFKLSDLKSAQDNGLYLVWAHDIDGFIDWIQSQSD